MTGLLLLVFVVITRDAVAQDDQPKKPASSNPLLTGLDNKVDEIVQPYLLRPNTAGLSIGILKRGKTYFYGYGETEKGNNTLPDPATIFEIGSISKTFTATLLAIAAREKRLGLNDPVNKYLPDSIPALQYNNRVVTLIDLSNHTSAIPRMPSNFMRTATDPRNPYANYSIENLYTYLAHLQLTREPGTQLDYSNTAVGLLGVILQKMYDTSYEALMLKYICDPLHMEDTRLLIRKDDSVRFAKGYNALGKKTSYWYLPPAFAGAGGIRSTARDMLKYAAANLGKAPRPLNKAIQLTHEVTFSKNTSAIGLNWFYRQYGHEKFLYHNGATGGFRSYLGINEKEQFAVVILSNCTVGADEMGIALMKWLEKN